MIASVVVGRFARLLEEAPQCPVNEPALDAVGLYAALAAAARSGEPIGTAALRTDALSRRACGVTLPAYLAALKNCRQTCRDLVRRGDFILLDRDALDDFIVRSFDALELDCCTLWSEANGMGELVGRIRRLHALGLMIRPIGHEINNLLQPIIGMAFSVRRKVPPESAEARNLGLVIDAGKQAAAVVNDLLDLARRRDDEPRPVDPWAEVERAVALLRFRSQPGVTLHAELIRRAGDVSLSQGALTQIVLNLAVNGMEAMAQTGGRLTIALDAAEDAVILEVRDSGVGMTPEVLSCCRRPFFTTKSADPGAGLGLSVVQDIVAAAGGALDIDSAAGCGAVVRVMLPAASEAQA